MENVVKEKKKYLILILICFILITLFIILFLIFRKKGCGKNCNIPCINCCYEEYENYYDSNCPFDYYNQKK